MKKLLFTALLAATTLGFSQSNEQGTIHVNVLGGFLIGSGSSEADVDGAEEAKFKVSSANYGVKGQYGLSEKLSAGISLKYGAYVMTPKDANFDSTITATMTVLNIGLEGRYYFVNNDNFNAFGGPTVGFSSGKDSFAGISTTGSDTKFSGLNYGINAGINYYFNDVIGGTFQAGYEGNSLSGTASAEGTDIDFNRSLGGVNIMAGMALRF